MMLSKKCRMELQMLTNMETRALSNDEAIKALEIIQADAHTGSKCDGCNWKGEPEVCRIQCGE